jgi:glycosyltransferase involved in cell wall biosynthesis
VRSFLSLAEKLAVNKSNFLVADSLGIQSYIKNKFQKHATYIAYGAHPFTHPDESILKEYQVEKEKFNMIMARFEPENNFEMVLDGVVKCSDETPILVIGNSNTKYGEMLKNKYKAYSNICFIGAVYNLEHLNNLRFYSKLYFHGHSVGGTNPSLLEAMASQALVLAHNNDFNKGILKENSFYFSNSEEVKNLLLTIKKSDNLQLIQNNFESIINNFNWEKINGEYLQLFEQCLAGFKGRK